MYDHLHCCLNYKVNRRVSYLSTCFEDLSHMPFMDNYCTHLAGTLGMPLEVFQQTTRQNTSVTTILDTPTCSTLSLIITTPGRTHHHQQHVQFLQTYHHLCNQSPKHRSFIWWAHKQQHSLQKKHIILPRQCPQMANRYCHHIGCK